MPSGKKSFNNVKDKKIKIIGVKQGKSPSGVPEKTYYDLCGLVWANYRSLSGDQYFAAKATGYSENTIFTVNWREDIKPDMYVLYRNKVYKILYIDDLEGYKKDLKLHCETSTRLTVNEFKEMAAAVRESQ